MWWLYNFFKSIIKTDKEIEDRLKLEEAMNYKVPRKIEKIISKFEQEILTEKRTKIEDENMTSNELRDKVDTLLKSDYWISR